MEFTDYVEIFEGVTVVDEKGSNSFLRLSDIKVKTSERAVLKDRDGERRARESEGVEVDHTGKKAFPQSSCHLELL